MFVSLVPVTLRALKEPRMKDAWKQTMVFALCAVAGTTSWALFALPRATLSPEFLPFFFLGVVLTWSATVVVVALPLSLWGILIRALWSQRYLGTLLLTGVFVMLQYAGMQLFTFVGNEPGVGNAAWFSFGFIGYPLADSSSFLQLAALGGVYLLSLVAVLTNLIVARILYEAQDTQVRIRLLSMVVAGIAIISIMPVESLRSYRHSGTGTPLRIGMMSIASSGIGTYKNTAPYRNDLLRAVETLDAEDADVIVLPEGAQNPGTTTIAARLVTKKFSFDDGDRFKSGAFLTHDASINLEESIRTKIALVPQGEYVPYILRLPLALFGQNELLRQMVGTRGVVAGTLGEAVTFGQTRASMLFCSEIFMPRLGKRLVNMQGSSVLLISMSHASFARPSTLGVDVRRALKVQAVEAGVPLVASTDYATTYAFDRYGRELARVGSKRTTEFRVVEVPQ